MNRSSAVPRGCPVPGAGAGRRRRTRLDRRRTHPRRPSRRDPAPPRLPPGRHAPRARPTTLRYPTSRRRDSGSRRARRPTRGSSLWRYGGPAPRTTRTSRIGTSSSRLIACSIKLSTGANPVSQATKRSPRGESSSSTKRPVGPSTVALAPRRSSSNTKPANASPASRRHVDPEIHRVAGAAREPGLARRNVLESDGRALAGQVAQHPCPLDLQMHHRVVVRGRLDARDPCAHPLRRDVVDARRLGGLHHQIATRGDRAEQRVSGPLLGLGDGVVVEPDRLDLSFDDPRPALPAAPVGTAERG